MDVGRTIDNDNCNMITRDKYDIILDILRYSGIRARGSRIIEVIKGASLDRDQAKEMVMDMLEIGLLDFDRTYNTLKTTARGWRFVTVYEDIKLMISASNSLLCAPLKSHKIR